MLLAKIKETLLRSPSAKAWKKVGVKHHHGIDVSLAALRSKTTSGIGDFFSLIPLIKWCKKVGFDVIQLLPINDSGTDPSPYNCISSCALNTIYLSLSHLPYIETDTEFAEKLLEIDPLNASPHVLYLEVLNHKMNFLRHYLKKYEEKISGSKEYKKFIADNNTWLEPYSLFKAIKDKMSGSSYLTWPKELKTPTEEEYNALLKEYKKETLFYSLLQFLSFDQLKKVKKIASDNGVLLKGDIPILISPDSADVWHYNELFNLELSAGAPPDVYNPDGQYWGFPLFNWTAIKKSDYGWWKMRLQYAAHFYDIFRIDHVIGFFRLWAIILNSSPKNGKFVPSDESLWGPLGKEILSKLISFTGMLPIAEDLGPVPLVVRPILLELGICTTKVMRWERLWEEDKSFIPINEYPPVSMTCISTHDSPTLAQWWVEFPEEAKAFAKTKNWDYTPVLTKEQRLEILFDSHHTSSLFHINLLQEYLNLCPELSWQDIATERINLPGKVLSTNWTYRYRATVEEITENTPLIKALSTILSP